MLVSNRLLTVRKDLPALHAGGLERLKSVKLIEQTQDQGPSRLPLELLEQILECSLEVDVGPEAWTKKQLLDLSLLCKSFHRCVLRMLYRNLDFNPGSESWIAEVQLANALQRDRSKGELVQSLALTRCARDTGSLQDRREVQRLFECVRPRQFMTTLWQDDFPVLDLLNASRLGSLLVKVNLTDASRLPHMSDHPWISLLRACAATIEVLMVDIRLFPGCPNESTFDASLVPFCPNLRTVCGTDFNTAVVETRGDYVTILAFPPAGLHFLHLLLVKHARRVRNCDIRLFRLVIDNTSLQRDGHKFEVLEDATMEIQGAPGSWGHMLTFLQAAPALVTLNVDGSIVNLAENCAVFPGVLVKHLSGPDHFASLKALNLKPIDLPGLLRSRSLPDKLERKLHKSLNKLHELCKAREIHLTL